MNPLLPLLEDSEISEIIVNDYDQIFFEKAGILFSSTYHFADRQSYYAALDEVMAQASSHCNRERPFLETEIGGHRYSLVFSEVGAGEFLLSVRKPRTEVLMLQDLKKLNWCSEEQFEFIRHLVINKKNLMVVGPTSSGKTTLLKALLAETSDSERCVIIEDTAEIKKPNKASAKLLARTKINDRIAEISLEELVKRALRLRPDRLVVGEVRGSEAYALLLALSAGHGGSFCSLHAENSKQALLRLEMLVQLGAPRWDLRSIRRLIAMSLNFILVVERDGAQRRLKEICELKSVEENGILLDRL